MVAFLRWVGSIFTGAVNGILKFIVAIVLLVLVLVIVLAVYGVSKGDRIPSNIVLALDLRKEMVDSTPTNFSFGNHPQTVMEIVLGLDAAERQRT